LREYEALMEIEDDKKLPKNPEDYTHANGEVNFEDYGLDILGDKGNFTTLVKFMVRICLIPQSNCYIERMFSIINVNKNGLRNCLDVSTVAVLLKTKLCHCEEKSLEITGEHLE